MMILKNMVNYTTTNDKGMTRIKEITENCKKKDNKIRIMEI